MTDITTPHDLDIRSRPFYKLLLVSGLVGVTGALLTFAFFLVLKFGMAVVWEFVPQAFGLNEGVDSPLFILATCLLGGLLVGFITHLTKVKPQLLAEEMEEITNHGRIDPRSGLVGMVRGLVGLIFGGSIGPEGPLTGGSGALGTWLAERLRMPRPVVAVSTLSGMSGMFGSFLASPFGFAMFAIEGGLEKGKLSWKLLLPSIVAASVGYTVFFALTGYTFGGNYQFPGYDGWNIIDLGYAVVLGLAGGALGLLFIFIFRHTRDLTRRSSVHPIGLAVLGGLILGVVGMFFPLVLFSGDAELQVLLDDAAQLGLISLLALAVLKVLVTAMCLSLGWSGGYIFPSFFMGAALGLAIHQALPFMPGMVCLVCVMSGVAVALMKSPIALALIVQALFDVRLAPVIAISILVAFLLTYRHDLVPDVKSVRSENSTALQ